MICLAVPLDDLHASWETPAGSALLESILSQSGHEDSVEIVEILGERAIVLPGPDAEVVAVARGLDRLVHTRRPTWRARLFETDDGASWHRVKDLPAPIESDGDTLSGFEAACVAVGTPRGGGGAFVRGFRSETDGGLEIPRGQISERRIRGG